MTRPALLTLTLLTLLLLAARARPGHAEQAAAPIQLVVQREVASESLLGGSAFKLSEDHALTLSRFGAALWERSTGRELRRTESLGMAGTWQQWHLDLKDRALVGLTTGGQIVHFELPGLAERAVDNGLVGQGATLITQLSPDRRWAFGVGRTHMALMRVDDPKERYQKRIPRGSATLNPNAYFQVDADGAPVVRTRLNPQGEYSCWAPLHDDPDQCPELPASDPDDIEWRHPEMPDHPPALVARGGRSAMEPPPTPATAVKLLPGATALVLPDRVDAPFRVKILPGFAGADDPPMPLVIDIEVAKRSAHLGPLMSAPVRVALPAGEGVLYSVGPTFDPRWWLWSGDPDAPPRALSCLAGDGETELLAGFAPVAWTDQGPRAVVEDEEALRVLDALDCEATLTMDAERLRKERLRFLSLDPDGERSYWARLSPPGTCELTHVTQQKRCVTQPWVPMSAAPTPDGRLLQRVDTPFGARLVLVGLDGQGELALPETLRGYGRAAFSPDMRQLAVTKASEVRLLNLDTLDITALPKTGVTALAFTPDGLYLLTMHSDGLLHLWGVGADSGAGGALHKAALVPFPDGSVAAIDDAGRLDYTEGRLAGLHFVFEGPRGPESIELDQLKRYYYEPDLILKHLGLDGELRPVVGFDPARLPPRVRWTLEGAQLHITLVDRGGGYGPVRVSVGGRELIADARTPALDLSAPELSLSVDLSPYQRFLTQGELLVIAFDAEERVSGRGGGALPEGLLTADEGAPIDFFAVVISTGEYADPSLSLPYADADADAIAQALRAGAESLLAPSEGLSAVHLVTTAPGHLDPSRENIKAAFDEIAAQAGPEDVLVVYLAGHGVSRDGAYHYPLSEASSEDLADPELLQARSLSYDDIMDLLRRVPANKRLLILDTCESGGFIQGSRSSLSADAQRRALAELRDRMGMYILAGAPAGRSAYESPVLGHGLLTYVLLQGLSGDAPLQDGRYWDTSALLTHAVDGVPALAQALELGDIQAPVTSVPGEARSFIFGARPEDPAALPQLRSFTGPPLVGGQLLDAEAFVDHLELSGHLRRALLDLSTTPTAGLRVAEEARGAPAWRLGGLYRVEGGQVTLDLALIGPDAQRYEVQLVGDEPQAIGECVALWATQAIAAEKGRTKGPPSALDPQACDAL